jgi:hypothetical protein
MSILRSRQEPAPGGVGKSRRVLSIRKIAPIGPVIPGFSRSDSLDGRNSKAWRGGEALTFPFATAEFQGTPSPAGDRPGVRRLRAL